MRASDFEASAITPDDVRRARRAYFANLSYVDERIGDLLAVLDRAGMADDTAVLFVSDHGDMLGERGLWFKMSFREPSARVPLMLAAPGLAPGRRDAPVSLLDVLPTLAELAGIAPVESDGESLLGTTPRGPVPMEYAAEGAVAPLVALRDGRFKLTLCEADPPLLHDLEADPLEAREPRRRPRPRRHPRPPHRRHPRPLGPRPLRPRRSARARPAAASSTRRCAPAPTPPGTTSRSGAPPSATCATTWT